MARGHTRAHVTNQRTIEMLRDMDLEGEVIARPRRSISWETVFCTASPARSSAG